MTDKTETVNWRELEPGDRVSVTFEAQCIRVDSDSQRLDLFIDGHWSMGGNADAMTFTRKPRPIELGERVRHEATGCTGTVLAIDGAEAWVLFDENALRESAGLSNLTRITGEVDQ